MKILIFLLGVFLGHTIQSVVVTFIEGRKIKKQFKKTPLL